LRCGDRVAEEAQARELYGIALHAQMLAAHAAVRAGKDRKARRVHAALDMWQAGRCTPTGLSTAALLWLAARALQAAGDTTAARTPLAMARARLREVEWPQVPDAFRDSFAQRNVVHRDILAATGRGS